MATASSIIAIDLGASSIKIGVFRNQGQGLVVDGFATSAIPADLSQEDQRNAAITQILRETLTGQNLRSASVSYCVSGQLVFNRFVKLPASAPGQIGQMVRFEAQQNVPFPIDEVVWDYQLLQPPDGGELEAIIVAIKADVLDRINAAVMAAGCLPKRVDVAPLCLYNAARFNYADQQGSVLLLDIGAKATQLIFIEGGRLFIRGVPLGSSQITQAIAQDMQINFMAAESLKIEKGFVSLGGAYEDPADVDAARVSKVIRMALTRLHAEISRSIVSYRTQQGGTPPSTVLLSGGGCVLPYLDLFLSEKLRLPVQFFNPLRNVAVGSGVDREGLSRGAHLLGETIGLALREIGSCPVEVNLTPTATRARLVAKERRAITTVAIAVWVLVFILVGLTYFKEGALLKVALDDRTTELNKLNTDNALLKKQQDLYATSTAQAQQIADLIRQRNYWKSVLNEFNHIIPTGVWITSLKPAADDKLLAMIVNPSPIDPRTRNRAAKVETIPTTITHLQLDGFYEAYDRSTVQEQAQDAVGQQLGEQSIKYFLQKLMESPYFTMTKEDMENPKLVQLEVVKAQEEKLALAFKIRVKLKEPISLVP